MKTDSLARMAGMFSRRPAVLLGSVQVLAALSALIWALLSPRAALGAYWDAAMAVTLITLVVVGFLNERRVGAWWWETSALITLALLSAGAMTRATPQGYMTINIFVLALVTVMATFVRYRRLLTWQVLAVLAVIATNEFSAVEVAWLYPTVLILIMLVISTLVYLLVSELESMVLAAAESALTDSLTGLLNRRGFEEDAMIVHPVALRAGAGVTLVMLDLDGFKQVNDMNGHPAGDALLVALARAWETVLRDGDVLARMGGDEFAMVLPNTGLNDAEALVSRLHAAHPFPWSHGCVDWDKQTLADAVEAADALMYAAKNAGR